MYHLLTKYWTLFSISISERLTYRIDFMFGTLMRFLPIITTIFLWTTVFASAGTEQIAGMSQNDFIAYYILAFLGRAFSSMPGLSRTISLDIREGSIKRYLIQPVDMIGFLFVARVAHKLVYYLMAALPFAIVFYICRQYFPPVPPWYVFIGLLYALFLAFLIGFCYEAIIGVLGFWLLEISSFSFVLTSITYVLSGHMFPLDMLGEPYYTLATALPFQYLTYFPCIVYLRGAEWTLSQWCWELGQATLWAVLLLLTLHVLFRRGLRHYSAFGG